MAETRTSHAVVTFACSRALKSKEHEAGSAMGGEQPYPAVVESFVAEAAACGTRGPVRILEHDARAWQVCVHDGDPLLLDEYGDLWWARVVRPGEARVIRPCWPEERRRFQARIAHALETIELGPERSPSGSSVLASSR